MQSPVSGGPLENRREGITFESQRTGSLPRRLRDSDGRRQDEFAASLGGGLGRSVTVATTVRVLLTRGQGQEHEQPHRPQTASMVDGESLEMSHGD